MAIMQYYYYTFTLKNWARVQVLMSSLRVPILWPASSRLKDKVGKTFLWIVWIVSFILVIALIR